MKPVQPKTREGFWAVVFAKDQPEYLQLPAITNGNRVSTEWELSFWERLRVLWRGRLYLDILTFGQPLQPTRLETYPDVDVKDPNIELHDETPLSAK